MKKILLKPLSKDHLKEVHSLWSDEQATLYTNFPYISDLEGCKERLDKVLAYYSKTPLHFGPFTIWSEDGSFLGLTGGDVSSEEDQVYEIWYFVQRRFWGQKVATFAVRELINQMSQSGRVRVIKADAVVDNEPSWKFLESLGFARVERIPNSHIKGDQVFDRYVYSKKLS